MDTKEYSIDRGNGVRVRADESVGEHGVVESESLHFASVAGRCLLLRVDAAAHDRVLIERVQQQSRHVVHNLERKICDISSCICELGKGNA